MLQNPKGFCLELLNFLNEQFPHLQNLVNVALSVTIENRIKHTPMALQALGNVIKNYPGTELQCIGFFPLLFNLLNIVHVPVQQGALNVISIVIRNNECVNNIANSEIIGHLLLFLYSIQDCQMQTLQILYSLMATTKIVKESMNKGAVIYLLDLFCNSPNPQIRETCAELIARMSADKLVGPKICLLVGTFLPPIFSDAMRDSPQSSVNMFESAHEHPELIWDQEGKDRVCAIVSRLRQE